MLRKFLPLKNGGLFRAGTLTRFPAAPQAAVARSFARTPSAPLKLHSCTKPALPVTSFSLLGLGPRLLSSAAWRAPLSHPSLSPSLSLRSFSLSPGTERRKEEKEKPSRLATLGEVLTGQAPFRNLFSDATPLDKAIKWGSYLLLWFIIGLSGYLLLRDSAGEMPTRVIERIALNIMNQVPELDGLIGYPYRFASRDILTTFSPPPLPAMFEKNGRRYVTYQSRVVGSRSRSFNVFVKMLYVPEQDDWMVDTLALKSKNQKPFVILLNGEVWVPPATNRLDYIMRKGHMEKSGVLRYEQCEEDEHKTEAERRADFERTMKKYQMHGLLAKYREALQKQDAEDTAAEEAEAASTARASPSAPTPSPTSSPTSSPTAPSSASATPTTVIGLRPPPPVERHRSPYETRGINREEAASVSAKISQRRTVKQLRDIEESKRNRPSEGSWKWYERHKPNPLIRDDEDEEDEEDEEEEEEGDEQDASHKTKKQQKPAFEGQFVKAVNLHEEQAKENIKAERAEDIRKAGEAWKEHKPEAGDLGWQLLDALFGGDEDDDDDDDNDDEDK